VFKTILDYLIYVLLMGIIGLIGILPQSLAMKLGEQLGKLCYLVDKRHRQVALNNLQKAFAGEKTPEQLREIAQGSFINLGRFFVEFCCFFNLKKEEINQWPEIEGW
jgi:KDO2-lipid IV(A) lauroyltransferase